MTINLYNNTSEPNEIGKSKTLIDTVTATIKHEISYENPTVILQYAGTVAHNINYMYISDFNRYYYITDIKNLTGSRYEITGRVDVLESFKNSILALNAVVDKQQNSVLSNMYYNDGSFVSSEKEFIYTKNFPQGFNDDGEFILITAGGIAT